MKPGLITENTARAIARNSARLDGIVDSFLVEVPEHGSDLVVIPTRVSDGTDGTYSGIEQAWDIASNDWTDVPGGIVWADGSDVGLLVEYNKRTGLDGSVFGASYFADSSENVFWAFFGGVEGADGTASFRHYLDGTTLHFYDGTVWDGTNAGVIVNDGGGFNIGVDQDYWVETSTPYDGATSVTGTVQNGNMLSFMIDEGDPLKTYTPILKVIGGVPIALHEGDIFFQSLYTPEFNALVQNGKSNRTIHWLREDETSSSDSLDGYFMKWRKHSFEYLGGELWDSTDIESGKLGGRIIDDTMAYLEDIDTSTEHQWTLTKKLLDFDIRRGLVEQWDTSSNGAKVVEFIDWIGSEVGGIVYHKNSPADGTTSDFHWLELGWDGTNMTVDGTGYTDVSILVDIKGHIYEVNGENQPPDTTNFRYEHCTDPATFPDLIFDSSQANDVVDVAGECYFFVSDTEESATDPVPTVLGTYADCETCFVGPTNEEWRDCSTDSSVAILSAGHSTDDYAWLCIGSEWVKAYNAVNTGDTPTDPTVLEQCGTTPTDCTDLVGWPVSDDFSGTGCDSGAVSDTAFDIRWTAPNASNISASYSSGKLVLSTSANGVHDFLCDVINRSGDFYIETDLNITSWGGTGGSRWGQIRAYLGAVPLSIGLGRTSGNSDTKVFVYNGTTDIQPDIADQNNLTCRIRRSSGTIYFDYNTGSGWTNVTSISNSNALTKVGLTIARGNPTGSGTQTCEFDYIKVVDDSAGSGNEIYIDPTGSSCT